MIVIVLTFVVGFGLGRYVWRRERPLGTSVDRGLLLSMSYLLEDAEAGLSSIEGTGDHRGIERFTAVKSKVCLAQMMARNLLGVDQQFGVVVSRQVGLASSMGSLDFDAHDPYHI